MPLRNQLLNVVVQGSRGSLLASPVSLAVALLLPEGKTRCWTEGKEWRGLWCGKDFALARPGSTNQRCVSEPLHSVSRTPPCHAFL
jgi:hypothetical protein